LAQFRRTTGRFLSGAGAYLRAIARNSLGKGNRVSLPGQPPTSRTKMLKNSIQFGVDMVGRSVVIGPTLLRGQKSVSTKVPSLLEYGGRTRLKTKRGSRPVLYRARPFMGPALIKTLPKLDSIWQKARLKG
jgi:hypothetical protein